MTDHGGLFEGIAAKTEPYLDALGAVGLGRAFAFSGAHGNPLWRPGREIAVERHAFLEAFVGCFEREWRGEL